MDSVECRIIDCKSNLIANMHFTLLGTRISSVATPENLILI